MKPENNEREANENTTYKENSGNDSDLCRAFGCSVRRSTGSACTDTDQISDIGGGYLEKWGSMGNVITAVPVTVTCQAGALYSLTVKVNQGGESQVTIPVTCGGTSQVVTTGEFPRGAYVQPGMAVATATLSFNGEQKAQVEKPISLVWAREDRIIGVADGVVNENGIAGSIPVTVQCAAENRTGTLTLKVTQGSAYGESVIPFECTSRAQVVVSGPVKSIGDPFIAGGAEVDARISSGSGYGVSTTKPINLVGG